MLLPLPRMFFLLAYFVYFPSAHKSICINLQIPERNKIIYNISCQGLTRQLGYFTQLFNLFVFKFKHNMKGHSLLCFHKVLAIFSETLLFIDQRFDSQTKQ
jgi:hypothetical protein